MELKEQIQTVYQNFKLSTNNNTQACLEFLNWLHYEKDQAKYLYDMEGLTQIEKSYISQLLEGKISKIEK